MIFIIAAIAWTVLAGVSMGLAGIESPTDAPRLDDAGDVILFLLFWPLIAAVLFVVWGWRLLYLSIKPTVKAGFTIVKALRRGP
jgi:hypothetical protein